jgi:glutamine synthetase
MFGYSLLRAGQNQPFFKALMEEMPRFGIPIEGLHTETGPGVYEAAILYSDALEAADRATLFKTGAKEIGNRFGIMPSFMAKWSAQFPGCSGHVHQSVSDGKNNVFYDSRSPRKMSKLFESYLAGQLHCLKDIQVLFAPTINSYKRLVDGFWAPVKATWGVDNRTASLRVISGSPKSTRLETRCPGADSNPYLAVAACVGAGLYGIEKGLKLDTPPLEGDSAKAAKIARLPRNLMEATENMKRSKIARELFGEEFVDHYVKTREWEWRQFQDAVTDWELKRYFEII